MRLALPKLSKSTWAWIGAGVAVVVAVIVGVQELPSNEEASSVSTYSQHPEDVAIASCQVIDGRLAGQVKITNSSADDATYAVKVSFASPDGQQQYGNGVAILSQLRPQKSSLVKVNVDKRVGEVPVECSVLEAARYGD